MLFLEEPLKRLFYHHGIFCASHPLTLLTLSGLLIFTLSYPALRLAYETFTNPQYEPTQFWESPSSRAPFQEERFKETFGEQPFLRLEQFVINASDTLTSLNAGGGGVVEKDLLLYVLELQERIGAVTVDKISDGDGRNRLGNPVGVSDICYKPFGDGRCLIHSPVEFWHSQRDRLEQDADLLGTLSNGEALSSFGTPIPLHSVFGGIVGMQRGNEEVKKGLGSGHAGSDGADGDSDFLIKGAASIVLTYFLEDRFDAEQNGTGGRVTEAIWDEIWKRAVKAHDNGAVTSDFFERKEGPNHPPRLIATTTANAPRPTTSSTSTTWEVPTRSLREIAWRAQGEAKHLFYVFGERSDASQEGGISAEYMLLFVSYGLVFLYISLVLGRFELVKSKFGLGLGAVVMVFCSLLMSVGLSSMMGVTTSLAPMEVFPFLIIAVGVENIFVLTNGVVTTSLDLPVKERVGLGLSRVGTKMSISLAGELFFLLLVSTINIPSLQEFCLFASVAIVMDFFMQITFFVTILAIDIRRLELSDLHTLQRMQQRRMSTSGEFPSQLENSNDHLQRKTPWSLIMIGGFMVLLGLGFYGSSADNIFTQDMSNNSSIWENSMSVTADAVWNVINPSKSNRYVEIRPPVHITVVYDGDPAPESPSEVPYKLERPKSSWRIQIDTLTVEMSPSIFTGLVVTFLLLFTLSCIFVTSVLYSMSKGKKSEGHLRYDQKNFRMVGSGAHWLRCPYKVININLGGLTDICLLATSDCGLTVWADSEGEIYLWDIARVRKGKLVPPPSLKLSKKCTLTCLAVEPKDGLLIAAGTTDGRVLVWDSETESLVCNIQAWIATVDIHIQGESLIDVVLLDGTCYSLQRGLGSKESAGGSHHSTEWEHLMRLNSDSEAGDASFALVFHKVSDRTMTIGKLDGRISVVHHWEENHVFGGHRDEVVALHSDAGMGVLASGSVSGDLCLWDMTSGRQIVFIPHEKAVNEGARRSGDNFDDGIDSANTFLDGNEGDFQVDGSRTSAQRQMTGLLAGHRDSITKIRIKAVAGGSSNSVAKWSSLLWITASADQTVKIWRVTLSAEQRRLIDIRCVKTIHQPGCTSMEITDNLVVGARKSPGLDPTDLISYWEVWMCDLESSFRTREIRIAEDLLSGVDLPSQPSYSLRKCYESDCQYRHLFSIQIRR
ncbi:hypothetical protein HDU97_004207 [Phlyctochytrium planicorne]|nr:hypothetical protein HDU97_004207 [Phlyctochytrium planicorne]